MKNTCLVNLSPRNYFKQGKRSILRFLFLYTAFFYIENLNSQSLYYPPITGNTWDTISPSQLGWCQPRIDSLYKYLENKNTKAFILLKDGKIVLEKYFGTFRQDSSWYWASAGKTLTAFTVGIAQKQGSLNIYEPSSKYLGNGWSSLSKSQEDSIKIWNHLTMTTGLDDAVSNLDCTDPSCLLYKAKPGTRWSYHNAPYTLLDKVIENSTGKTLNTFIAQNISAKTGIKGLYLKLDYNNVFFSTPRSMARFGLLLLSKGSWNGTKILDDTQYFKQQTNTSQQLNKSYGYLTWLNGKQSFMLPTLQNQFPGSMCSNAPNDMYAALGKNGQIINVVPSSNLVFIRMGNASDNNPAGAISVALNDDIWKFIKLLSCNSNTIHVIENENKPLISVHPNPISNNQLLTISLSQYVGHSKSNSELTVQIVDNQGRVLYKAFTNSSNNLTYGDTKSNTANEINGGSQSETGREASRVASNVTNGEANKEFSQEFAIQLPALSPGTYYISIHDNNRRLHQQPLYITP